MCRCHVNFGLKAYQVIYSQIAGTVDNKVFTNRFLKLYFVIR